MFFFGGGGGGYLIVYMHFIYCIFKNHSLCLMLDVYFSVFFLAWHLVKVQLSGISKGELTSKHVITNIQTQFNQQSMSSSLPIAYIGKYRNSN